MEFKICRVCLDRSATIPVFDKQGDIPYFKKIMRCVNVVIEKGDGFPDAICEGCAADLAVTFDFAQRCEASDRALRCLDLLQATSDHDTKHELDLKPNISPVTEEINENAARVVYNNHYELDNDGVTGLVDTKLDDNEFESLDSDSHILESSHEPPHQSRECSWQSASQTALHARLHSRGKPFSCPHCHKSYSTEHYLTIHMQRHATGKRKKQTKRAHTKRDPLQCTICGVMRANRYVMESHMRTHTGEKPFPCEVCGARFRYKEILNRHVNSRHHTDPDKIYKCEHCGKVFYAKGNIQVHMRIHSGLLPYQCPYCPKRFNQISSMIRHRRTHTGDKPYVCATCGKAFNDSSLLNRHQAVHSSERKHRCSICNKHYKTKGALKVHVEHHNSAKLFVCSACGLTFTFKGNLKVHMRRKHSEKSGSCAVCGKHFGDVEAHMRVHTGNKPFACKICSRSYSTQRSLTHHVHQRHKEPDKYRCSVGECGAAFPLPNMLRHHVAKSHGGRAPHACPACARAFLRRSDLTRHLKLNHLDNHALKHETQRVL